MILNLLLQLKEGYSFRDILPGILFTIIVVVFSLSLHEMCHAYAAYKMGDHTARNLGRLTLNPKSHLDLLGTVSMMLIGFGWAKPVPINSRNFKNPRAGIIVTSISGPLSNLLLSFISLILYAYAATYLDPVERIVTGTTFVQKLVYFLVELLYYFHALNLYLAIFNLLPIPPLDGSKILLMLLPYKAYLFVTKYDHIIRIILFVLLFMGYLSTPLALICTKIDDGMIWLIQLLPGI